MIIDIVKHSFVSSYNAVTSTKYKGMRDALRGELFEEHPSLFADASHSATRRIGFSPIPLVAVAVRALWGTLESFHRVSERLAPILSAAPHCSSQC